MPLSDPKEPVCSAPLTLLDGRVPADVATAARALSEGQLLAFATETVYGLGARADDAAAVRAIYAAKGRPADHPLIVHTATAEEARRWAADWSPQAERLAAAFWPGPLTLVVPRRPGWGDTAAGGQASIGLRVPGHPVAQALLREAARLGVPGVAAPSANRFGRVSPTLAEHVVHEFQGRLSQPLGVLDGGACPAGIESTLVDVSRGRAVLLRPGVIGREALRHVLGAPIHARDEAAPRASGTLASHYAPSARLTLLEADALASSLVAAPPLALPRDIGRAAELRAVYSRALTAPQVQRLRPGEEVVLARSGPESRGSHPVDHGAWIVQSMPDHPAAVAQELFRVMRSWDLSGVSSVWVEMPPGGAEWDGVRDRLQRAAA